MWFLPFSETSIRSNKNKPRRRGRLTDVSLHLEALERRQMLAISPVLLADLNPDAAASNPGDFVEVGSSLFFAADNGTNGRELWRTDGTPAGTTMVKDLYPGTTGTTPNTSDPKFLTNLNGTLFFVADDGTNGRELWKSDGTEAGTVMVTDLFAGITNAVPNASDPQFLTNVNGTLFFSANDGTNGRELWKSDGTAAGTVMVKDLFEGETDTTPNASDPAYLTTVNGTLFFSADDGTNGRELWKSDGTAAGTAMVKDLFEGETGTTPNASDPAYLTNVNGTLFFSAEDGTHGRELWKSDGTADGTALVKDLWPGSGDHGYYGYGLNSSYPWNLTPVNGTLFFAANGGTNGDELWKSDGTAEGTTLVKDLFPGAAYNENYQAVVPNSSQPGSLANGNGVLFFAAADGTNGRELWQSDGTAAGSVLVKDLYPGTTAYGPNSSDSKNLTAVNGTLYFSANDGVHGAELWQYHLPTVDDYPTLTGIVYRDLNGNGAQDAGETPLAGIQVFADANDNAQWDAGEVTATTGADGSYTLRVPPGVYYVTQTLQGGWVQTSPRSGNVPINQIVEAEYQDVFDQLDFGDYQLVAPAGLDLLSASDSGVSDSDNLTNFHDDGVATALKFSVNGVADAATVMIYADGVLIGQGVAAGGVAQITTTGTHPLADGAHTITAAQNVFGAQSSASAPLSVLIDTTAPAAFTTTPPGVVGKDETYQYDANSPDESAPGMVYSLAQAPSGASIGSNGLVTWAPTLAQMGPNPFEIRLTDAAGNYTSQAFQVVALDAISALADAYTLNEDQVLTVAAAQGVLANDGAGGTATLTAVVKTQPGHGSVVLNLDGSFTYTPAANYFGTDGFTYAASDGMTESNVAPVTFTIQSVNDPPTAVADTYTVNEDTALNVTAAQGVLANDTDDGPAPLVASLKTQPAHGTVTLSANGSFQYTPAANYYGADSFTYTASDGALESTLATVTINVTAVNDPPVAVADTYNVDEDQTLVVSAAQGVLANDSDAEGSTLSAAVVSNPLHGTLTLAADGSFTYVPSADYFGTDTFAYRASDGSANSAPAAVTLVVHAKADPPVARNDQFQASQNGDFQSLNVLANDTTEPDGVQSLAITAVGSPSAGGTATIAADGQTIRYKPAAGYAGAETFSYTITDADGLTAQATASVNVTVPSSSGGVSGLVWCDTNGNGLKDAGEWGLPGAIVTLKGVDDQGTTVQMALLTDYDGAYLFEGLRAGTYEVNETQPAAMFDGPDYAGTSGGTVANDRISGIIVTANTRSINNNFSERGLKPQFVSLSLFLASTPPWEQTGPELMAHAEESVGHATLAAAIRTGTTEVPAGLVNRSPVSAGDAYTTAEDAVLTVPVGTGVVKNDSDPDGDPLSAVVATNPSHGTLTLNANGSFTYTPAANYNGSDSFTYKASDGSLQSGPTTVILTITPVPDAPTTVADTYNIPVGGTLVKNAAAGVLANDSDPDGGAVVLTAALGTAPAHGTVTLNPDGSFTYTPTAGYHGSDSFTYTASDGTLTSAPATVNIAVDTTPAAVADSYSTDEDTPLVTSVATGVLANDTDADSDPLTAIVVANPAHGTLTLNTNGTFSYTPAANYHGSDSFTYKAKDGALESATTTVTLTINSVNDAPVAVADTYTVAEDATLTVTVATGVLKNDTDIDGDALTAVVATNPAHGTLTLNADGSFTYVPNASFSGTDTFTYKAKDAALQSNAATVTITVTPVNDAPVALADAYSVAEDTTLTVPVASGVLANDTDVDGDAMTAALVASPSHGTLTLSANGSFTYVPNANFNGADSFTYKASDAALASSVVTVTITVTPVNDAPAAAADVYAVVENDTLNVVVGAGVLKNDTDVDGDALSAILATGPAHGTLTLNADGSFLYAPNADYSGTDTFTYKAKDAALESNPVTVTINIAPEVVLVATADSFTATEDTTLTVQVATGVLANDPLVGGSPLTAVLVGNVSHGTLTLTANGSFTYVPAANYNGGDSFTYKVTNGTLESAPGTVTITVSAVNDAPVSVGDAYTVAEDTTLNVPVATGVLVNDSDVDSSLTAVVVTQPTHGALTLNPNGSFTYVPAANYNGSDSFTYKASDGTLQSAAATVTLTVTPVEDPASFQTVQNVTLLGGSPLFVPLVGVDPDGQTLTYTATSSNPSLVSTRVPQGNRSLRISVANFGNMVLQLHEDLVPGVTARIAELAGQGFYNGLIFHRVIDGFMIQGGDPLGTGTGGSGVDFDDQFHVDLQHNQAGVLSMAKSSDDTNDSQFFITDAPTRYLDFNHSVFGMLVEGKQVLQAISAVPVSTDPSNKDKPLTDVVMTSVTVFQDTKNALVMLKAPEGASGSADITVTVNDGHSAPYQQTFHVTVTPDTSNGGPFLNPIGPVETAVNTPVVIQLSATDVEGDAVTFGAQKAGTVNSDVQVDETTGRVTVTPPTDFSGDLEIMVGVKPKTTSTTDSVWDTQLVTIHVGPQNLAAMDAALEQVSDWLL
ncbi:MAG: Ig-like domain-containing protein [Pirellulales bacterium]